MAEHAENKILRILSALSMVKPDRMGSAAPSIVFSNLEAARPVRLLGFWDRMQKSRTNPYKTTLSRYNSDSTRNQLDLKLHRLSVALDHHVYFVSGLPAHGFLPVRCRPIEWRSIHGLYNIPGLYA